MAHRADLIWVKFPTVRSLTLVKCPGISRGDGRFGIDWYTNSVFNRSYTHQSFTNEPNDMKQYQVTRERRWYKMREKSKVFHNSFLGMCNLRTH